MRLTLVAVTAMLLSLLPAPTYAQRATPTPAPAITAPALCTHIVIDSDPTVPVSNCTYPSGTGTVQTAYLDDPTVTGSPLLYIRLRDGMRVWSAVAEQVLPNAFAADNGPILRSMTGDGRYPRCTALAGVRSYLATMITSSDGYMMVASTTDGASFCMFSVSNDEVRTTSAR